MEVTAYVLLLVVPFVVSPGLCQPQPAMVAPPSSSPVTCPRVRTGPQFWSSEFRTCLPCKPCLVTLAPCGPANDAICGDASDVAGSDDHDFVSSGRKIRFGGGGSVARVRESVRNSAQSKDEFLTGLRERTGGKKIRGGIRAINSHLAKEEERDSVDGKIRYAPPPVGGGRNGRRRSPDSLHSDLQAIERALLSGADRAPTFPPSTPAATTTTTTVSSVEDSTTTAAFAAVTDYDPYSLLPPVIAPEPTFAAAGMVESDDSDDYVVLGKKRLYAARDGGAAGVGGGQEGEEEQKEVFGAVRQNPDVGSGSNMMRHAPDEFGLLHNLLYSDGDDGSSPSSSSTPAPGATGASDTTRLLLLLLLVPAAVAAGAVAGFVVLRRMGAKGAGGSFKMLDNGGGHFQSPPAHQTNLVSSHSSSFRRSTDSRITGQTTAPNSPKNAAVGAASSADGTAATAVDAATAVGAAPAPSAPNVAPSQIAGSPPPPPSYDMSSGSNSSSVAPGPVSAGRHQFYLSYVDRDGRTGVVKTPESSAGAAAAATSPVAAAPGDSGSRELPV